MTPEPVQARSRRVLLLVDFINPLDFDGAEALSGPARRAAAAAARLKRRLGAEGVPAIYVNDNFGHWRSEFRDVVAACRRRGGAPAELARRLAPRAHDLTVLKPRHSGFQGTPLQLLLTQIGAREVVVTGLATDLCVQFTAADAFLLDYRVWVPPDCCAAEDERLHAEAIAWMRRALKARTSPSAGRPGR
jgi:nicotinamidase-related amidase